MKFCLCSALEEELGGRANTRNNKTQKQELANCGRFYPSSFVGTQLPSFIYVFLWLLFTTMAELSGRSRNCKAGKAWSIRHLACCRGRVLPC